MIQDQAQVTSFAGIAVTLPMQARETVIEQTPEAQSS